MISWICLNVYVDVSTAPWLLAVVGHFTDETSRLHTVTLGLLKLQGEYSDLNQAGVVLDLLKDYGIRNKFDCLVMDNITPS